MLAFDTAKISFHGSLRFCGPDLARHGDLMREPDVSNLVFGNPVFPDVDGAWRMYYLAEPLAGEPPGYEASRYAESTDGLAWTPKGALSFSGVPEGTKIRHLSVLRPSPDDPKWKLFAWAFQFDLGFVRYVCCESGDGIRWRCLDFDNPCLLHPVDRDAGGKAGFEGLVPRAVNAPDTVSRDVGPEEMFRRRRSLSNDATATYRLPGGGYETYSVWLAENPGDGPNYTACDNAAGAFRVIQRRTSSDGLVWSMPEISVPPDPDGPYQLQYYYLNKTRFHSFHLGMLGRYACDRQTIEPEFVWSRDGRAWERPYKQPWLRLEDEGEGAGLIHTAHHLVDLGPAWRVYYSVSRFRHNNRQLGDPVPRRRSIHAADVGKGRLLGIAGSGIVETRPFLFTDGTMAVDANVAGSLRAELLDLNGRAVPGRTFADAIPVSGNGPALEIRWRGQDKQWICCDMLSIRFAVDNGVFHRFHRKEKA